MPRKNKPLRSLEPAPKDENPVVVWSLKSCVKTLRHTEIENRTLTAHSIHVSTIMSCTLINCAIYDCELYYCEIYNCTFTSSALFNSNLYGPSKVLKCRLRGLNMLPSSPAPRPSDHPSSRPGSILFKLPVEIRNVIADLCLSDTWNGKLPEILAAFKGCTELYHPALQVFRTLNADVLWEGRRGSLLSMVDNPLTGIKTLVIDTKKFEDKEHMVADFGQYVGFQEVHIEYLQEMVPVGGILVLSRWVGCILNKCPSVTLLTARWTFAREEQIESHMSMQSRACGMFLEDLMSGLKSIDIQVDVSALTVAFTCRAEDGKTLCLT